MIDSQAQDEVQSLLGDASLAHDRLIENLHLLQDHFGCLHARHLAALAAEMRLSQAEVFEVASFYHHFDVIREGESAPARVTLRVCDSLSCALAGADDLVAHLEASSDPAAIRIQRVPCIGRCDQAPACQIGKRALDRATPATLDAAIADGELVPEIPLHTAFAPYVKNGGYHLLAEVAAKKREPEDLIETLSNAALRGLGGAGFPAGRKWSIVRGHDGEKLMTVNADEGEPGTFKDRYFLESDPHRILEGALIAANVVAARRIYIYLRDEYPAAHAILTQAIAELDEANLPGSIPIELRRGAGAYICGEESAMLSSIEGKRGLPRHRPPYIAQVGLFGRPTLNHNVETLYWIREIVEKGSDWFVKQGREGHAGLRSYSVSGRVAKPGVKIAPAGITARELIEDYCGGMMPGHALAGYLPGGASGGILPASMADIALDFGTLEKHGSFVGSHAVIVLSDKDGIGDAALNLIRFFQHESCGQCTPCRAGTEKMAAMLAAGDWDATRLGDLQSVMHDASICGLGQAAANPVMSVLKYFTAQED